jgi:hypothetical protein
MGKFWLCLTFATVSVLAHGETLSPQDLAKLSPLTQTATRALQQAVNRLPADTREKTQEALFPAEGCIAYLSGVDEAAKASVLEALSEAKFIEDRAAASRSLFDYPHDGKTCPTRHQSVTVAPGGEYEGHHAWPGGLAVHEAYNLHVAQDFVRHFRTETHDQTAFDNNVVTAAVVWHDWAKTVEFQWEKGRIVNYESKIAGTGSHHIIGPALHKARAVLAELASDFGYAKTDAGRYAAYENTVLAFYGADAIALSPREKVRTLVNRLKAQGRL